MTELANPRLTDWQTSYVIVGSSGAALIGIQFVVITLIATRRKRTSLESIGAFATPTVVHLGGALIVSSLMSAPWTSLVPASAAVALCGLGGLDYGAIVIRRARRQVDSRPVREDWIWYAVAPCAAHAVLTVGALLLSIATRVAEFAIGAAALLLLSIGIHNAWDTVTHLVVSEE